MVYLTSIEKKQKHTSKVIINVSDSLSNLIITSIIKKDKTSKSIKKSKKRKSTTVSSTIKRCNTIKRGSIIKRDSTIKRDKARSSK